MNEITFQRNLASVMFDNKFDRFVKNRRTGKLDTRSLYKVNTSTKLFKRKEERKNKHYAVSLVVDCSGSMSGSKIEIAGQAAEKMSYHLGLVGINHNIVLFGVHVEEIKPFSTKYQKGVGELITNCVNSSSERRWAVWSNKEEAKDNGKSTGMRKFVQLFYSAKEHTAFMKGKSYSEYESHNSASFNSDAEALRYATRKLNLEKGKKLMILLSDGIPAPINRGFESPINPGRAQTDFKLKTEVDHTIKSGVELFSIGILHDSVNNFYPKKRTCTITDLKQLYPHVLKLIKINLKRG